MTDPKKQTRLEYWLALASVEGLGGVRIKRLLKRFGSVQAIFEAELPEIARLPTFNPVLASRILTVAGNFPNFRERLTTLADQNVRVRCLDDPDYPAQLKDLPDTPGILCSVGTLTEVSERCVSIVGTRAPSIAGIEVTLSLATQLALAGFTVVSGLAPGIDTYAHAGTLAALGTTIAVIGTDLSAIYPTQKNSLAKKITDHGCIFSEHPFYTAASPGNLVQRNRIISGLSIATIVIEAKENGGAMHTARYAELQGRHVMACRWGQEHPQREGPAALIQKGAFPFAPDGVDRVIEMLKNPEQLERPGNGADIEQPSLF